MAKFIEVKQGRENSIISRDSIKFGKLPDLTGIPHFEVASPLNESTTPEI